MTVAGSDGMIKKFIMIMRWRNWEAKVWDKTFMENVQVTKGDCVTQQWQDGFYPGGHGGEMEML